MKRLGCILLFILFYASLAQAAVDSYSFDDPQLNKRFIHLTENLRCPKCLNQNIADSNAMIASDMRRKVHQLLSEGMSEDEIVLFMKARYGDFVYYQPPLNAVTALLWLIPLSFVFFGFCGFLYVKKSKSNESSRKSVEKNKALAIEKANSLLGLEKEQ
ncbi:cytochrome c-type biogenesis protein CcmH [Alteromonas sp. 5E99-2]|uniref:cytochrome c-type biogenesis protein n=1 Tax=Alteromonas sp. 5E99-2 TaxID=2817683 RepID=UPI001A98A2E2|nr:cytochrome c-type biogenesis protein [Alteromonas sp. 5E99-2]MBO1254158.1 cytochrome c-type biogenesis protein CcmH [Alteromonas sp. 5E99-2]